MSRKSDDTVRGLLFIVVCLLIAVFIYVFATLQPSQPASDAVAAQNMADVQPDNLEAQANAMDAMADAAERITSAENAEDDNENYGPCLGYWIYRPPAGSTDEVAFTVWVGSMGADDQQLNFIYHAANGTRLNGHYNTPASLPNVLTVELEKGIDMTLECPSEGRAQLEIAERGADPQSAQRFDLVQTADDIQDTPQDGE